MRYCISAFLHVCFSICIPLCHLLKNYDSQKLKIVCNLLFLLSTLVFMLKYCILLPSTFYLCVSVFWGQLKVLSSGIPSRDSLPQLLWCLHNGCHYFQTLKSFFLLTYCDWLVTHKEMLIYWKLNLTDIWVITTTDRKLYALCPLETIADGHQWVSSVFLQMHPKVRKNYQEKSYQGNYSLSTFTAPCLRSS